MGAGQAASAETRPGAATRLLLSYQAAVRREAEAVRRQASATREEARWVCKLFARLICLCRCFFVFVFFFLGGGGDDIYGS